MFSFLFLGLFIHFKGDLFIAKDIVKLLYPNQ